MIYVNPAFEQRFSSTGRGRGRASARRTLFEGGAREAILTAVAEGLRSRGREPVRFRLREGEAGFLGLIASPIEAPEKADFASGS